MDKIFPKKKQMDKIPSYCKLFDRKKDTTPYLIINCFFLIYVHKLISFLILYILKIKISLTIRLTIFN